MVQQQPLMEPLVVYFTFDVDPADGSIIDSVTGEVTNAVSGATYSVLYTTGGTCMDSEVTVIHC